MKHLKKFENNENGMKIFQIKFKHTVEETYTANVEAMTESQALELFDENPFDYVEGEPEDTQGLDIDIIGTKIKGIDKKINESQTQYIITGKSNSGVDFYYNEEDGTTAYNKNKVDPDATPKKIFSSRKEAENIKKDLLNWRDDIRWYIESL